MLGSGPLSHSGINKKVYFRIIKSGTRHHRFINQPFYRDLLAGRRTSVEPCFDLIAKVLGAPSQQKQLPVQCLANVRSCLALAAFSIQLAMIVNSIWGLNPRNVSHISDAFS